MNQKPGLSRREFLRSAGLSGVAITLGSYWTAAGSRVMKVALTEPSEAPVAELMSWISIDESGSVTLFNHRSEMGQGTWQTIPQLVAEELEVNMDQVSV